MGPGWRRDALGQPREGPRVTVGGAFLSEKDVKGNGVMTRKKARAIPARDARKPSRGRLSQKTPLEPLALELYGVVRAALTKYGLSSSEQKRLFTRAERSSSVKPVSGPVLHQFRGLGDLISTWLEEMPYVDDTGKPKVLNIHGRGATFESLARQFLPQKPLADVVALACGNANVGTLPGGRIALFGDTMVDVSKNREVAMAQTILHIKQIFETCLHNVQTARDGAALGRLERIVDHVISAEDFEKFQKAIRPQLHDMCERIDRLLRSSSRKRRAEKKKLGSAGIGLYVYYDGDMKHVSNDLSDAD
jgi:Family of unknown function (DUF6502)